MKTPSVRIAPTVRLPLTWATAGLTVLWGCQQLPCSRSPRASHEVYYQGYAAPAQPLSAPSYEEVPGVRMNESITQPAPKPVEVPAPTPAPMPKEPSLKVPAPEPQDMTVPRKVPAPSKDEPKKEEPKKDEPKKEPATEKPAEPKPAEPKPAEPEKPKPTKKKPAAKPKTKKPTKPKDDSAADDELQELFEERDPFASDDEAAESETEESAAESDQAIKLFEPRALTPIILEVPPAPEMDESAPRPRELPSAAKTSRPINDRQPMFLAPQLPEIQNTRPTTSPETAQPNPALSNKTDMPTAAPTEQAPDAVVTLDGNCDHLVFDREGFGYVTQRQKIIRFAPTGETTVWTNLTNPKGHRIEPEGTHLVCDVDRRAVLRLSFDGKIIGTAAKDCDGTPLRAPFELTLDNHGGFYFTDPGFLQMQEPVGKIHYVDQAGNVSLVASGLGFPTGICFDSVRNRLLVVESLTARVTALNLAEPGRIASTQNFAELRKVADTNFHVASLCHTTDGTLFVTQPDAKTVQVFNSIGRPLGFLTTGELTPNAVAQQANAPTEVFVSGETKSKRRGQVIRIALGQ